MDPVQPPEKPGNTGPVNRADLFVQLARAVSEAEDSDQLPQRLCRTFVSVLGAAGGAITLMQDRSERTTVYATDHVASRIEDLEEVYGEGPGTDAFATGSVVSGALQEPPRRWPLFTTAARAALGPLVLHAFPMRTPRAVLGVATVYQQRAEELALALDRAQFLADAIGAALARRADPVERSPWPARDRINQAIGMVVAQLGVPPDDALALLRAFAFSHDLSLDQAASAVVERRHVFDLGDPSGEDS